MKKKKTNEATGGYYHPETKETPTGLSAIAKGALLGLGIPTAISWLEKRGDSIHDERNKDVIIKIKKKYFMILNS